MSTIGGDEITGGTIDAEDLIEITQDGDVVWSSGGSGGDYYNLAYHLPQWAIDIWHANPDDYQAAFPTQDVTSYANQSGDVATGIQNASSNNAVAYGGVGNEYYLGSTAFASGTHFGFIGENCTIHFDRNDIGWMLEPTCDVVVVSGTDFQLDESQNADAGLLGARIQSELWMEDVNLFGQRNQPASSDPNNYTVRPHLEDDSAEGFIQNVNLPDGEYYSGSGSPPGGSRTLGFSTDPSPSPGHIGRLVIKECLASNWLGNCYYISMNPLQDGYSDGETILWDCEAYNGNRGNMRVGPHDMIVGGQTGVSDMPGDLQGQPLVVDYATGGPDDPTEIIGLTVSGNDYQANAIVCRNFYYNSGDTAYVKFQKVVADLEEYVSTDAGYPVPISFRKGTSPPSNQWAQEAAGVEVELDDIYWHDSDPNSKPGELVEIEPDATVIAPDVEDFRVRSESNDELYIYSGGELEINGQSHFQGTYSDSGLGLESPLVDDGSLPEFFFNYEAAGIAP